MSRTFAAVASVAMALYSVPRSAEAQPIAPFDAPLLQSDAHALQLNPANLVFLDGTHGLVGLSSFDARDHVDSRFAFAGGFGRIVGGGAAVDVLNGAMATTTGVGFGGRHFGFGVASQRFFSKSNQDLNGVRNRSVGLALRSTGGFGLGMLVDGLTSDRVDGERIRTHFRPGFALRTNDGRFESDWSTTLPRGLEFAEVTAALRTRPTDGIRVYVSATARIEDEASLDRIFGGLELSLGNSSVSFGAGQFSGTDGELGTVATAEFHSPGLPTFRRTAVLRVDLAGDLAESTAFSLHGGGSTFVDVVHAIRTVARDDRFDGLYLNMGGLTAGTAQLYELREAIREVQAADKQVIAYFDSATLRDLYVAGGADVRIAAPTVSILTTGIGISRTYYGELLRSLGVEAQFVRIADYKSGPERFTNGGPSPESQEQVDVLLDDIWGVLVDGIAENLELRADEVETLLGNGPVFATDLLEAGHLDDILYRDELAENIESLAGRPVRLTSSVAPDHRDPRWRVPDRIAVLHIDGAIVLGESGDGLFGTQAGSDTLVSTCSALASDPSVDAVLVRIDSPGGSALASDRIHRALSRLAEAKPVVVSMGDVAASGGMYVAAFGAPIHATPNSVTGSIGIYAGTFGLDGLLDAVGINRVRDERGGPSSLFDGRGWDEETEQRVFAHIENSYQTFLEHVAAARNMTPDEVDEIGRGRLWSGTRALDAGLVDSTGGLAEALDALYETLELEPDAQVQLTHYPRARLTLWALLPSLPGFASADESEIRLLLERLGTQTALRWLAPWLHATDGEPMAMMEWTLEGF